MGHNTRLYLHQQSFLLYLHLSHSKNLASDFLSQIVKDSVTNLMTVRPLPKEPSLQTEWRERPKVIGYYIPCTQCVILYVLAPSHCDKVLEVELDLQRKSHEAQLFLAKINKNRSLFIAAKTKWDSWFIFLRNHSTSKTLLKWEGARFYKIACFVQGI